MAYRPPSAAWKLLDRVRRAPEMTRNVGPASLLGYLARAEGLVPAALVPRPDELTARTAAHPLRFRRGTSDKLVYRQIFLQREYSCLDRLPAGEVRLVLDLGANVGYSSAYFLTRFPAAKVIAVEPDPGNFAVLQDNLRPYGDRATAVHSGVWSRPCGLVLAEEQFGDGREWARHVRPCRPGEAPQMTAVDVGGLLAGSGCDRISVLKVDVEGAEVEVFGSNYEGWIGRCDAIVAELHSHDARCTDHFHRAVAGQGFELSRSGELTVCTRPGG